MEVDTLLLAEIVFIFVEKVSSPKRHFRIHGNIIKMFLSKIKGRNTVKCLTAFEWSFKAIFKFE